MRSHFEKYAFSDQILICLLNYIATVHAKTYALLVRNCCDVISEILLMHDVIPRL